MLYDIVEDRKSPEYGIRREIKVQVKVHLESSRKWEKITQLYKVSKG